MIDPNDVNLIIFDMDGTITPSLPAVYEAIKRAFTRLGWPVTFGAGEIGRFFGQSAAGAGSGLFEFITPAGSRLSHEEVREKVNEEYAACFRELAQPFPGVRETLAALRDRGYRVALYTNASVRYLNMVMSASDIRDCFDDIECIQENHLTKPELVRKFKEKFGCPVAAVVGDRIHDIEAARETGSLAIGVLFGYGGDEPEQADIPIQSFKQLLSVFDHRRPHHR